MHKYMRAHTGTSKHARARVRVCEGLEFNHET